MMLLKTTNELIALDLGTQAIALRIAQVKADEDREKIEALEARLVAAEGAAGDAARDGQKTADFDATA